MCEDGCDNGACGGGESLQGIDGGVRLLIKTKSS